MTRHDIPRMLMNGLCSACGKPTVVGTDCAYCVSQSVGKQAALVAISTEWNEHESDSPRFLRRLLFCLVSVIGLFAGLDHLIMAGMLVFDENAVTDERLLVGVLLASCLMGGLIAGTANRTAELTGVSVGILAGFAHLWQLHHAGTVLSMEWWIGLPVISGIVGLLAGFSGRLIYPPSPRMSLNIVADANENSPTIIKNPVESSPIILWRIILGIAVTLAGTYWAGNIHWQIFRLFGSSLGSMGGANVVVWQLTGLAAILGGIASGVYTKSGIIHGLATGFVSGGAINVLHSQMAGTRPMGLEFWQSISGFNKNEPQLMGIVMAFTIVGSALGGWLGSKLFQPSSKHRRLR